MSDNVHANINCPNCGTSIDVNEVLAQKLNQELKSQFEKEAKLATQALEAKEQKMNAQRAELEKAQAQHEEAIQTAVKQQLKLEKEQLRKNLKQEILDEQSEQLQSLQQELNEKSAQLKAFNKAKVEIERLKREKEELKDSVEAEAAKKLNEQLAEEKAKISKAEADKNQFSLMEKDKLIDQLKEQIEIVKRKAEQGSMQMQGEVQELAIEDWLKSQFPLDEIEEIKKGERGGDTIHRVNTRNRHNCGTIYYESKRTKAFGGDWIEKFKADIRDKGADIGVLVTQAMPSDMERMGLKDGVWICSFEEFKGLCHVLRESIVRMSQAIGVQENKGDKMAMLYDYLTGNEFRMQIEAIVEGFTQMQLDLVKEKNAMNRIWKSREKQIEKVIQNTTHMFGSVKGIAGNAVKSLPMLELGDEEQ